MADTSGNSNARTGKDLVIKIETAGFAIDTNEVLGVVNWGFTIPGVPTKEIVLEKPVFSKNVSAQFKAAVKQANTMFPYKIGPPKAAPGSPY